MYKLLMIIFIIAGGVDGGADVHVHETTFSSAEYCDLAASKIPDEGYVRKTLMVHGRYKIVKLCVRTEGVAP